MAVLPFIGDDQHIRIIQRPLYVFPSWAPSNCTAFVVSPVVLKNTLSVKLAKQSPKRKTCYTWNKLTRQTSTQLRSNPSCSRGEIQAIGIW